jgi:hypothetical protein
VWDGCYGRGNPEPSIRSLFRPSRSPPTMFKATTPVLSKASRRALTPKRGNKDFYKGKFIERHVTIKLRMALLLSPKAHARRTSQEVFVPVPLVNTL